MKKLISFLIPTIKHKLNSFDGFFFNLQEETEEFIESLESNYLLGLLGIPAKYVTINNEPYLLKNDGSTVALKLDSHFDLSNL